RARVLARPRTAPLSFPDRASRASFTLSLHDALPILLEEDTGLNGDGEVLQVIIEDLIHPHGTQHHAAAHGGAAAHQTGTGAPGGDRKSTRLNSSHVSISYAVFCLKKKTTRPRTSARP